MLLLQLQQKPISSICWERHGGEARHPKTVVDEIKNASQRTQWIKASAHQKVRWSGMRVHRVYHLAPCAKAKNLLPTGRKESVLPLVWEASTDFYRIYKCRGHLVQMITTTGRIIEEARNKCDNLALETFFLPDLCPGGWLTDAGHEGFGLYPISEAVFGESTCRAY